MPGVTLTFKRRQFSMTDRMVGIFGLVASLPMSIQFFFLWRAFHKKKSWLFVGEADAGQRGAVIYTLIECCRRRGIDPYSYLRQVLTRLPHMTNQQISEIMPETWEKAQKQVPRAA